MRMSYKRIQKILTFLRLASAAVVGLHVWKRNTLLSIAVGTVFYMFLVQAVF